MTLPGFGKNFAQICQDDYECRRYAYEQVVGLMPRQTTVSSGIESAAIGAGLGAASGVAISGGGGAAQ
ncbi:hypothetical protein C7H79_12035 [Nitrosomonas supralitoralis]|uniref:Uncharacterized protein n=2 Tax=Nitrosomonas supralitoralis TaxID=2116706 RepID=A0A2P7NT87_9PROT|nr:hypothetical protein C7H79_12035 [Nitrosomonas supralitoralis]